MEQKPHEDRRIPTATKDERQTAVGSAERHEYEAAEVAGAEGPGNQDRRCGSRPTEKGGKDDRAEGRCENEGKKTRLEVQMMKREDIL